MSCLNYSVLTTEKTIYYKLFKRYMSQHNDWFITFQPKSNAQIRLFCFHFAGSSASMFREWPKLLINHAELVAIQLPGREERFNETLLGNITQVIDLLSSHFNSYTDRPFILLGHSIGALIAFELARSLRSKGLSQPQHLIASGSKAPHILLKNPKIHDLPHPQFITELEKYGGMPSYIINDQELMSLFSPIIRSDFCISETYKYLRQQPFDFPITALGGINDNMCNRKDLIEWQKQTTKAFQCHLFPGQHFFINTAFHEVLAVVNTIICNEIAEFIESPTHN